MATDTLSAADKLGNLDKISGLSLKLHALLCNTVGEAGESFRNFNDEIQDNYMWACADMAGDLKDAVTQLARRE